MGENIANIPDGAVTKLYRHDCEYGVCPTRYSKFSDIDAEQENLRNGMTDVPIIHRHIFVDKVALAKYQDFDLELEDWTFTEPYKPIVHRWDRLNALCNNATESHSKQAIDELMEFLRPIVAPSVESLAETRQSGKVCFNDVWQIFPPGEFAVTNFFGVQVICRVLKYEKHEVMGMPPSWIVTLEYLDWNGAQCGYATTKTNITYFKGLRFVTSLPVFPLSFSESASEIKSRTIERGRKFESLRGYHFRTCVGTKILLETEHPEERPVAGRVIIDAFAYYQSNNIVKPQLRSLTTDDTEDDQSKPQDEEVVQDWQDDVGEQIIEGPEMTAKSLNKSTTRDEDLCSLSDEQCLLATPWLKGLDLKTKEWAQFLIDDLNDIEWNDAAFNHLVLPGNEKELTWAFVENKALSTNHFDDFVQDKVSWGVRPLSLA